MGNVIGKAVFFFFLAFAVFMILAILYTESKEL